MNTSTVRESRSVRLSQEEWTDAETIAILYRRSGAGHGIRAAINALVSRIICEGDGEYGEYPCPSDGHASHIFTTEDGEPPTPGEIICCGEELTESGTRCGYSLVWRGAEELVRIKRWVEQQHAMAGRS